MQLGEKYSQQKLYNIAKNNEFLLGEFCIIYFIFSYLICLFDIGSYKISTVICEILKIIIYTIDKNSKISPDINSSSLIISLAWIAIIPFSIYNDICSIRICQCNKNK